jgi:hypothetical protein
MSVRNAKTSPAVVESVTELSPIGPATSLTSGLNVQLDANSIVDILVQRTMDTAERERDKALEESARLGGDLKDAEESLTAIVAGVNVSELRGKVDSVVAALMDIRATASAEVKIDGLDRTARLVKVSGKIELKKNAYGHVSFDDTVPLPAPGVTLLEEIARLSAEKAKYVQLATHFRGVISDERKIERNCRAAIAETEMAKTADGQAWLDAIDAKMRRAIDVNSVKRRLQIVG